jgi:hypothetical protein
MAYEDDLADLQSRILTALRTQPPRVLRWYRPEATGIERRVREALDNPRYAAARLPGRLACRLLHRHNWTCIGTNRHPDRW